MKIDLHLHTKAIKSGENKKRNIDSEEKFKGILNNNNIGIAAITNHNHFDLEQFKRFSSEDFLLFPGVEIDVMVHGSIKQMNIICSSESAKKLSEITTMMPNTFEDLGKVKEIFNDLKPIYSLDFKNGNTNFSLEQIQEAKEVGLSPIIFDVKNTKTNKVLLHHEYVSFVGSDLHNWDDYSAEAKNLNELEFLFATFEEFKLFISKDAKAIKRRMETKIIKECQIEIEGDGMVVPVYKGANVLFGDKGTGKTEMLKKLAGNFPGKMISSFYVSDKSDTFKNIVKNIEPSKELANSFGISDEIFDISLKECKVNYFKEIESFYKNEQKSKYKIIGLDIPNKTKPLYENGDKAAVDIRSMIIKVETWKDIEFKEEMIGYLKQKLKELLNMNIKKMKDYWIHKMRSVIKGSVQEALATKKGIVSLPSKIGLFDFWENRNTWHKKIKKLNEVYNGDTRDGNKQTYSIPQKGELIVADFYKVHKWDQELPKNLGMKNKNQNFRTFEQALKNLLKKYLENPFGWDLTGVESFVEIVKTKFLTPIGTILYSKKIYLKNRPEKIYKPSEGEQTLIVLQEELNKKADIYIFDEPDVSIGEINVTDILWKELKRKIDDDKVVILSSHNGNLGLGLEPINMIYREYDENAEYNTYFGGIYAQNFITKDGHKNKKFIDIALKHFEGGKEAFDMRGGIYEIKNKYN